MPACILHQNLSHQAGGNSKEMRTVLPLRKFLPHQTYVRLVHQGRTLQSVVGTLPLEIAVSHAAQFAVDDGHQRIKRFPIPIAPTHQQLGYLIRRVLVHRPRPPSALGGWRKSAQSIYRFGYGVKILKISGSSAYQPPWKALAPRHRGLLVGLSMSLRQKTYGTLRPFVRGLRMTSQESSRSPVRPALRGGRPGTLLNLLP